MSSLVEKDNTIYVPAEFLGGEKGRKVNVTWSQSLRQRNQEYWVCKYTVKSGGSSEGVIYIQTDKLDEFKSKKMDGDNFTLKVDDQFQYGQDKNKTKRFLVFHNKDYKPYQHRYVSNTMADLGGKAADIIEGLGFKDINTVEEMTKRFVGDYLHNF